MDVERRSTSSTSSVLSTSSQRHCERVGQTVSPTLTAADTPTPASSGCRGRAELDLVALHEAMSSSLRHAAAAPPPVTDLLGHCGPHHAPSTDWIYPPPPPPPSTGRGYDWISSHDVKTPHAFTTRPHMRESTLLVALVLPQ